MAMTSLASQLKKLEAPQTALLTHRKTRASFLFDPKTAANFDRETFFDLGLSGLEELKTLNPHFGNFHSTLFDPTSKSLERAIETSEANEKLNYHIKNFLTLLSPYFLVTASHRAIEWLINRYHIQDFNVDEIMLLILPYHETLYFAKMLQILPIQENTGKWHWLFPVKKEGVPLSKSALLNRAAKDMGFLKFVCDMPAEAIKINGNKAAGLGTLFAFYSTTVIGALAYADPITENHISTILPSLMAALGSSLLDFTASGFMIIARLATKACLGDKILEVLFNKISKVDHPKLCSETSLVLVLLSQNVQKKLSFPEKGLRRLADSKWFLPSLVTLSKNKILIAPFVCALLRASLRLIIVGDEELKGFVQKILNDLIIDKSDAKLIFKCLLEEFDKEACREDTVIWYSGLFRDLEKSFPQVFDDTVSFALSQKQSKEAAAVETLLGVNTSRNDIYERLVHPNENIRINTIKKISDQFEPDQLGWLRQPLLERFKDESMLVVRALLKLPKPILDSLDQGLLVTNLTIVVSNFNGNSDILSKASRELLTRATEVQADQVFLALFPYVFQIAESEALASTDVPSYFKLFELVSKEGKHIQKNLWKLLNNATYIPSLKDLLETFNGIPLFKQKREFWSATALLASFAIPVEPNQTIMKSIMAFLISYLKHPKVSVDGGFEPIGPTNISKHVQSCRKMLIDVALHCINVLTSKSLQKSEQRQASWWDFSDNRSSFILSIYKVIHQGASSRKAAIQNSFEETKRQFLLNYFDNDEARINFLLSALLHDSSMGDQNVRMVNNIVVRGDGKLVPAILDADSFVVPLAFLLLGSKDVVVRREILALFKNISTSFSTGFYRTLVDIVLEHSDEISIDPEQVVVVSYSVLSPSNQKCHSADRKTAVKETVSKLFDIITAKTTPNYIKTALLEILEFVQSEELLSKTTGLALDLVGESRVLNREQSKIMYFVIQRFNESSVGVLKSASAWNFLDLTLSDQKTKVQLEDGKVASPCGILINQITKELFDSLPEPTQPNQEKLLSMILGWVINTENAQVVSSTASMFKKISLDCRIIVNLLTPMLTVEVKPRDENKAAPLAKPRRSLPTSPPLEILETQEWKKGVCLLEMIQNKKKMSNVHMVLPTLFNILKRSLQFEHQNAVEYPKQLLLSMILFCCQKLITAGDTQISPESLQVDLVVDCVRASHNPQTHHHALLALTFLARIIPEQILHNIMAIFTFIGSSVLRQDDAYSFQIISQIIDTVVPVLVKMSHKSDFEVSIAGVLRVFVAAFLDIPEHRRLPLLHKLMVTLNDGQHLWIFLALVFESHVTRPVSSSDDIEIKDSVGMLTQPKRLETTLELCAKFPPSVILNTSYKLMCFMNELPVDKDEKGELVIGKLVSAIFNLKENTGKQLRHFKFTLLAFLSSMLSSSDFVLQMADQPENVTANLTDVFTSLINQNLLYLKSVLHQVDTTAQLPAAKFWKAVLGTTYEILDKINALLPTDLFLKVIKSLLGSEVEAIRRKAMELLGWRLQDPRRPVVQETLFKLLPSFTSVVDSISKDGDGMPQESQLTVQTALFTLKLIARQLATAYVEEFKEILMKVTEVVASGVVTNWAVSGCLILCASELVSLLKSSAISVLPRLIPVLNDHLGKLNKGEGDELLLIAIVTAVHKIVESLANFMSPYLPKLLYEISCLSTKYENPTAETSKSPQLSTKLKAIRQKISSEVPNRVLVPAVATCYSTIVDQQLYSAISPLMSVLSSSFKSGSDLTTELTALFIKALQFRSDNPDLLLETIADVESSVIDAILTLTLKLSEAGFKPLYSRIFEWSNRTGHSERLITFYRLSMKCAESLKNLFNIFAGIFIENAADVLRMTNMNTEPEGFFQGINGSEKSCILVDCVIATLHTVFLYDSRNFVNKERFSNLMVPLVDQIENKLGGEEVWEKRCAQHITPCVAQMATSIADDSLWKQLNHHVLLKTRHEDYKVRLVAVRTVSELAKNLGEDFLPLLPETVPFLAELLEDNVELVEKETHRVVNDMEEVLGEPIQKYF